MDATSCCDTKRGKSERERQTPSDIIHTWNLKYGAKNEHMNKTKTDSQRVRPVAAPGAEGKGEGLGIWDKQRQIITQMEWSSNKVLLYGTGTVYNLLG